MVGSEDQLAAASNILFKRDQVEHVLTMANQFEIKTFTIYPRPTAHVYRAYVAWGAVARAG